MQTQIRSGIIGKKKDKILYRSNGAGHPRKRLPPTHTSESPLETITNRMRQGIQEHLAMGTFTEAQLMRWFDYDIRRR